MKFATFVLLLMISGPVMAATQADFDGCPQDNDVERSIAACKNIIADRATPAGDRALAYRWLGHGQSLKKDFQDAYASFSSAIELDPNNFASYVGRALAASALADKSSDRDIQMYNSFAVADYRKAVKLDASRAAKMAAGSPALKAVADLSANSPQDRADGMPNPGDVEVFIVPAKPQAPQPPPRKSASVEPSAGAKRTFWAHNGSTLYLEANGMSRQLYYDKPKPQLGPAGVAPGTLLFTGTYSSGNYSGDAFSFSRICGSAKFHVSGPVSDDFNSVTLRGDEPVRDQTTCSVTKTVPVTLKFDHCVKLVPSGSDALVCPIVD